MPQTNAPPDIQVDVVGSFSVERRGVDVTTLVDGRPLLTHHCPSVSDAVAFAVRRVAMLRDAAGSVSNTGAGR